MSNPDRKFARVTLEHLQSSRGGHERLGRLTENDVVFALRQHRETTGPRATQVVAAGDRGFVETLEIVTDAQGYNRYRTGVVSRLTLPMTRNRCVTREWMLGLTQGTIREGDPS